MKRVGVALILFICIGTGVFAQTVSPPPPTVAADEWPDFDKYYSPEDVAKMTETEAKQKLQKATTEQKEERTDALADFKKGAGFGITVAPSGGERIDEAVIVNNQIVVTKQNTNAARMMFEFHQLFTANPASSAGRLAARDQIRRCAADALECPMFGIGPFLALQSTDDDLVASVGVGIMLGVRNDPRKDSGFNIGIGVQWDSNAKVLARGFEPGKPLPAGETEIRFQEKGNARIMIALSLGFF